MFSLLLPLPLIPQLLKLFLVLLISLLSLFLRFLPKSVLLLRNRYCIAVANVFTTVIAAADTSPAKTISNTANIAAFATFDGNTPNITAFGIF